MPRAPAVLLIVLDAVGVPTLRRLIAGAQRKIELPNLAQMGLGNLLDMPDSVPLIVQPGLATQITQASAAADSVIGHCEMMGAINHRSYLLFHDGFTREYVEALEHRIGRRTIGNRFLNGEAAITQFREQHECDEDHPMILYASTCDPVLQIAAHEDLVPPATLADMAEQALALAVETGVGITRAISRPYTTLPDGSFKRTSNRHDATLPLQHRVLVDLLRKIGVHIAGVGKVPDLVRAISGYNSKPYPKSPRTLHPDLEQCFVDRRIDSNPYCVQGALDAFSPRDPSQSLFTFVNLVDTDSVWGHSGKDAEALRSIECFDRMLPLLRALLRHGDLLIITADHGMRLENGLGYHSLEPVPLLVERIGYDDQSALLGGLVAGRTPGYTQVGSLVAQLFNCYVTFEHIIAHIPAH